MHSPAIAFAVFAAFMAWSALGAWLFLYVDNLPRYARFVDHLGPFAETASAVLWPITLPMHMREWNRKRRHASR